MRGRTRREDSTTAAVIADRIDLLRDVLDGGADPNGADRGGLTALMLAVLRDQIAAAELLLARGAAVSRQDPRQGWSAVHFAARDYRLDMARLLLAHDAAIDPQDAYGNTPLMRAVSTSRGQGAMIALLLAHGADRSRQNHYGVSPESAAHNIGNYDVAQCMT